MTEKKNENIELRIEPATPENVTQLENIEQEEKTDMKIQEPQEPESKPGQFDKYYDEFAKEGKLTETSYGELQKLGLDRQVVYYSGSMAVTGSGGFIVDSEEKITSQYYFARAKNFEYNYTTNPSFTDNTGNLTYSSMINNPVTYITTVGLYNDSNDLVAVAKLSQPVTKDFTKEALIRVKLDY